MLGVGVLLNLTHTGPSYAFFPSPSPFSAPSYAPARCPRSRAVTPVSLVAPGQADSRSVAVAIAMLVRVNCVGGEGSVGQTPVMGLHGFPSSVAVVVAAGGTWSRGQHCDGV